MLHPILKVAGRTLVAFVAILAGCALSDEPLGSSPVGPSQAAPAPVGVQASSEPITEISVQRTCFRCADAYTLTLRRDGTATLVHHVAARIDAGERVQSAAIAASAFATLVAAVEKAAFSKLNDLYKLPDTADGSAITTTVTWGTTQKKVINSNGAGPPELKSLEAAIDAVAKALMWK